LARVNPEARDLSQRVRQAKPVGGGKYVAGMNISKPSVRTRRCESCSGKG
jgi:hypothetical protein